MANLLIILIRAYQVVISPLFPRACRFVPSCSEYACQALGRYGLFRGLALTLKRIIKCHPYHPGGWDPLP
ncbi:MAG: membrane protein insertion efficiency factor YidD [Deltaproteobacteria bacterium]|nr:membrane protein insertion efficiency factor YidD [Deltaproteobacteria bacterium]MBW1951505.1 membrane protein insertion efficiency factor YidD [Deltaproteobacteria bacterium]MBW1987424.1 membrane protein insertion efficiency factor YidD [Deltaproteobacteria bacterium]MBW2135494.1 membrane protein insertion efficiency factor YidD [Deltaproteobacteria bacterium]